MKNVLRKIIREQIDLLFESYEMNNDNKSYVPPQKVAETAQAALSAIGKAQQNGIQPTSIDANQNQGSGRMKAKKLAQKVPQSFTEMKRLKAFFEANTAKVTEERKKLGIIQQRIGTVDEMGKSNLLLVWNLHGGDACKKWVTEKLSNSHDDELKTKERFRFAGGHDKNDNKGFGALGFLHDPSQQRIRR